MSAKGLFLIVAALLVWWVVGESLFVVDQSQQVVITEFGRPVGKAIAEPGIYFKTPYIQTVHRFDRRYLEWNGDRNQIPTKDKRFVWVDTYARWRIVDPLLFYQRVRDERGAHSRLDDIIDGETRNAVANHDLLEVVRLSNREAAAEQDVPAEEATEGLQKIERGRAEIMSQMLAAVKKGTAGLGIEVIDVRFKQINYNEDVRARVFERMIAERQRIAQRYRSEGQGESARIRGEKERELQKIESEAYRVAEETRGRADAKAASVYAEAYNKDPEFYQFLSTLEAYGTTLDAETTLVLGLDSEFFRYLQRAR